jgi:hypothetical protein
MHNSSMVIGYLLRRFVFYDYDTYMENLFNSWTYEPEILIFYKF